MRVMCVAVCSLLCLLVFGCADTPPPGGATEATPQLGQRLPPSTPVESTDPGTSDITPEEAELIPPLPPLAVRVDKSAGEVAVVWHGTRSNVARYEIYRRAGSAQDWRQAGIVRGEPEDSGEYRWVDPHPLPGAAYGVAAFSPREARSELVTP